tara:strand:+ start:218 stop:433 length:216 start_codon:yes stop_codon:yes gene_type:complete
MSLAIYAGIFACGFLTDKLRIFPVLIGILIGYLIKTSVETRFQSTADIKTYFGQSWDVFRTTCGGIAEEGH